MAMSLGEEDGSNGRGSQGGSDDGGGATLDVVTTTNLHEVRVRVRERGYVGTMRDRESAEVQSKEKEEVKKNVNDEAKGGEYGEISNVGLGHRTLGGLGREVASDLHGRDSEVRGERALDRITDGVLEMRV